MQFFVFCEPRPSAGGGRGETNEIGLANSTWEAASVVNLPRNKIGKSFLALTRRVQHSEYYDYGIRLFLFPPVYIWLGL